MAPLSTGAEAKCHGISSTRRSRSGSAAKGFSSSSSGSALYESSPLQQRMRDLHVAAQHVGVQQRHYVNSGKLLLDSPAAKIEYGRRPPGRISRQEVGCFHSFRCFTTRTGGKKRTTSYSTKPDQKYHDATDVMK